MTETQLADIRSLTTQFYSIDQECIKLEDLIHKSIKQLTALKEQRNTIEKQLESFYTTKNSPGIFSK
jgi:hypothetical protein